jgi:hypothetical protein
MEPIKKVLFMQMLMWLILLCAKLGTWSVATNRSMFLGQSSALLIPTREQLDVMSFVKKYKIYWHNGKRRIAIKYKRQ